HDRDGNATKNLREEGIRILSTYTDGQSEFQACGEQVSLVSNSAKKRFSVKQESPVIVLARAGECQQSATAIAGKIQGKEKGLSFS
ncbi:hypothetical protein ACE1CD_27025, partial [Aerosakkonema sp. BLCC-F183]